MIQCYIPDKVLEHTGAATVSELTLSYMPNGFVTIRKKKEPVKVSEEAVEKCRKYICDRISELACKCSFSFCYTPANRRTTVILKPLDTFTGPILSGLTKLNTEENIYCPEVGIAIALCRALNGKKCDYEKIIGIKMA